MVYFSLNTLFINISYDYVFCQRLCVFKILITNKNILKAFKIKIDVFNMCCFCDLILMKYESMPTIFNV